MPRPPNPRRKTLGPVSMNRNNLLANGSTSGINTPSKGTTMASISSASNANKQRKSRQSMLPRMGRESSSTSSTGSGTGTENGLIIPSSPSNTVVSSYSSRRSIGGSMQGAGRPSIGGGNNNNNSVVKLDPRPIQDKVFQQHCIRTLLSFLTKSGYEYPVNLKSLAQPSAKDFSHIVTFLLKQIDPTFGTTDLKMEEEVAQHFKTLGYPCPVSKTALVAAGSPHTWPSLLAALAWLVEHIMVLNVGIEEEATLSEATSLTKFESLVELEHKTDRAFFQYLHRAYAAFLEGATDKSDALIGDLIDMFEEDNIVIEREIERVTEINATIAEKIHILERQSETLPAMTKKREEYATDLEQFHDLIRQMEEHCAALSLKVHERTKELHNTHHDLQDTTDKIELLQQRIATQPLTVEQVQKMHSEQARLKEAMEKAMTFKEFNMDALEKAQEEVTKLWEDLELLIREYNEEALELSRNMAEFAQHVQYKMTLHKSNSKSKSTAYDQVHMLGGVNIMDDLMPFLQRWKTQNVSLLNDTRHHLQAMLDDLEVGKKLLTEFTDKDKIVDMKLIKLEETFENERDQQEATLRVRLQEVEIMEQQIESVRDPASLEEQICALQRQCDSLERLKIRHLEETSAHKNAIQEEIQQAIVAIEEYNQFICDKLMELNLYTREQKNHACHLKP